MKKFLKKLHLWVALVFFLPLVIQALTGALLILEDNFKNKIHIDSSNQKTKPISQILLAAQTSIAEENYAPSLIKFAANKDDPTIIRFAAKDGKKSYREVVIDQNSLAILHVENLDKNFFRLIKKFHARLFIDGDLGYKIVSAYGFALLFLGLSGIIIWLPKPKKLLQSISIRLQEKGYVFYKDTHKAFGFWLSIFLVLIAISGIYLCLPKQTSNFIFNIFDGKNFMIADFNLEKQSSKANIDEIVNLTKNENLFLQSIKIPSKENKPYQLNFIDKNQKKITIIFDQFTKKTLAIKDENNFSVIEKFVAMQNEIHTGKWLGTWGCIINFIAAISIVILAISGIALWILKKKKKKDNFK